MATRPEEGKHAIYGIWTGTPGQKIDLDRKPDAYVVTRYGRFNLGDASSCSPNTYAIPKTKRMTFGVREVSEAGRQGKGKTITLKVKTEQSQSSFFAPM